MTPSTNLTTDVEHVLAKFDSAWSFDIHDLRKPSSEAILKNLINTCPESNRPRLLEEFLGCGPLEALLKDTAVNEILVNGPTDIYVERSGHWVRHEDHFQTEVTFKNFVEKLCREASIKVDMTQPFANGRWRGFRLHVAANLSHCSNHLSLRRLGAVGWSFGQLVDAGWCDASAAHTLRELLKQRKNVIVVGPTGSGKTTVLGALLNEISPLERTIIIEDTDELPRPNGASTKMLTRPQVSVDLPAIDLSELVRQSLRMRPERLVVGEVRGGEAKDLLMALATGHSGSWGTLHATDARQALLRLEMLIQLGAPQWNLTAVRQLLNLSVDAIVVCENDGGVRRLGGIFKIAALESFGFLIEDITVNR